MRIAVLCERMAGERRVAVTPEATRVLVADGHSVVVESGAGTAAGMPDGAYLTAGATVASASFKGGHRMPPENTQAYDEFNQFI